MLANVQGITAVAKEAQCLILRRRGREVRKKFALQISNNSFFLFLFFIYLWYDGLRGMDFECFLRILWKALIGTLLKQKKRKKKEKKKGKARKEKRTERLGNYKFIILPLWSEKKTLAKKIFFNADQKGRQVGRNNMHIMSLEILSLFFI